MSCERLPNAPWLFIDYDDTIGGVVIEGKVAPTHVSYETIMGELTGYLSFILNLSYNEVCDRFQVEYANYVDKEGLADRSQFERSWLRVYRILAGLEEEAPLDPMTERFLVNKAREVFEFPYVALPGALDTLFQLARHYNIAIVTKGAPEEQLKKLENSGVNRYADAAYIVGRKDINDWYLALSVLGQKVNDAEELKRHWAIGNSPKGDINIPLAMGMNAIWIDATVWEYEYEPCDSPREGRQFHRVFDFTEVLPILVDNK